MSKHNFTFQPLLKCFAVLLTVICFTSHAQAQFVHTRGTDIVDADGNKIYMRGMNLGNWLLWEGYLMMGDFNYRTHTQFLNSLAGVFGSMDRAKEFEHQWRLNYVTEETIIELRDLGFNSVRVPFHYNMFWDNGRLTDHGFQYFDRLIEWCRTHEVYILIDMHAAPGYQNPGDHSDNMDSNAEQPRHTVRFWDGDNVNIASQVWRHIAARYVNESIIWGYDLINEPVSAHDERRYEILPSMIAMRNAIREVDNNHAIVAEGEWWGSNLWILDWTHPETQARTGISSAWDHNLVYQTHHYPGQGEINLADLDERRGITDGMNIPLILGEYGENTENILAIMRDWSVENIAGAFPWSFKKMSHERTIWTIPQNEEYRAVVNAIATGGPAPANAYENMIAFAQNNIANGSSSLVFHQNFYDATKVVCDHLSPSSLSANENTPGQVRLSWQDNSNEESHYRIYRDGSRIASIGANSTSFTDSSIEANTCYNYEVVMEAKCSAGTAVSICTSTNEQSPFHGSPVIVPGIIQAEDFDLGGNGIAYNDLSEGNEGEAYRFENVDIEATVDNRQDDFNVGWTERGEWLEYTVNVIEEGEYLLDYRVATPENTGRLQFMVNGVVLSTTNIQGTGGWASWSTERSVNVHLAAGEQVIRIRWSGPNVNLNHFTLTPVIVSEPVLSSVSISPTSQTINFNESLQFTATGFDQHGDSMVISTEWSAPTATISSTGLFTADSVGSHRVSAIISAGSNSLTTTAAITVVDECQSNCAMPNPVRVQAEAYSQASGVEIESTQDSGGGSNVGWIDAGDWMIYNRLSIPASATGEYEVSYRVASLVGGGSLKLEPPGGGAVYGTINVPSTGGWQSWQTIKHNVTLPAGTSELAIAATGGGWNINWFEIVAVESGCGNNCSRPTPIVTPTPMPGGNCNGVAVFPNWQRNDYSGGPNTHQDGGDQMVHQNNLYTANWYTNSVPGSDHSWTFVGACN